jgi:hypothetical protein
VVIHQHPALVVQAAAVHQVLPLVRLELLGKVLLVALVRLLETTMLAVAVGVAEP